MPTGVGHCVRRAEYKQHRLTPHICIGSSRPHLRVFCSKAARTLHTVLQRTDATLLRLRATGPGSLLRLGKREPEVRLWIQADTKQPLISHERWAVAGSRQLQGGERLSVRLADVSVPLHIRTQLSCNTMMALTRGAPPADLHSVDQSTSFQPSSGLRADIFPVSHGRHHSSASYESSAFFITNAQTSRSFLIFGDVEADSVSGESFNRVVWQEAAERIRRWELSTIFIECSYSVSLAATRLAGGAWGVAGAETIRATAAVLKTKGPAVRTHVAPLHSRRAHRACAVCSGGRRAVQRKYERLPIRHRW